jgi:hypothetical protein
VLAKFPGAQIVSVRQPEAPPPPVAVDDDELPPEVPIEYYSDDDSAFAAPGRPDDWDDDL